MPNVKVVAPNTGDIVEVPEANLEKAMAAGYRPATADELRYQAEKARFDTPLATVGAFTLGAASELSAGILPRVIRGVGGEQVGKDMEAMLRHNEGAKTLGQIVGLAAPLPTGKAGIAGKALRGATALPRGMVRAGTAVERVLARKMGEKAVALPTIGKYAMEGAIGGASNYFSETGLYDLEIDGEKLAASALFGAGVGGAVGGVAGVGKKAIGAIGAQGVGDVMYGAFSKTSEAVTGLPAGKLAKFNPLSKEGRKAIQMAEDAPLVYEALAKEGRRDVQKVVDVMWDTTEGSTRSGKPEKIAQLVRRDNPVDQIIASEDYIVKTMDEIDRLIFEPGGTYTADAMKAGVRNELNGLRNEIFALRKEAHRKLGIGGDLGETLTSNTGKFSGKKIELIHQMNDEVKKRFQKLTKKFQNKKDYRFQNVGRRMEPFADDVMVPHLTNEKVFGNAARYQRGINKNISQYIPSYENFRNAFLSKEKIPGYYGKRPIVSDGKWNTFATGGKEIGGLRDLTSAKNRHFDDFLDEAEKTLRAQQREFSEIGEKYVDDLYDFDGAYDAIKSLRELRDKARQHAYWEQEWNEIGRASGGGVASRLASFGGIAAFASGMPGLGVAAYGVGAGLRAVERPQLAVQNIAKVQQALSKWGNRYNKTIGGIADQTENTVRKVEKVPLKSKLTRAIIPLSRETSSKKDERMEQIRGSLSATADETREDARELMAFALNGSPTLVSKGEEAILRAKVYMLAKMPRSDVQKYLQGERPAPSKSERNKFLTAADALADPLSILDGVQSGKLTTDAVHAVKMVYPAMFSEMQTRLIEEMTELTSKGKKLKYPQRLAASKVIDAPVDPTMDWLFIKTIQGIYMQGRGGEGGNPQQASRGKPGGGKNQYTKLTEEHYYESGSQETERGEGR